MATLCQKCELQCDGGRRLPKVLPCGHTACLACLEECARTGGRMCPVCRKVFKSNIDKLVTLQNPKANTMWCRDCEAEAKATCFEQHVLCGLGRMQRETAVELEAAWDGRAALLNTLAEDVRAEKQQLKQERDTYGGSEQQQQQGLAALRGALAAAKEHPLHGLPPGHNGVHAQGGLLHRALGALRKEDELRAREAAVLDKEATVDEVFGSVIAMKLAYEAKCEGDPPASSDSDDSDVSVHAPAVPGLDSLPEKLLQHILAFIPLYWTKFRTIGTLPHLLSLRLVCRRWARSVLSPAVWQHREWSYNGAPRAPSPGLLRNVSAVRTMACYVEPTHADSLQTLADSPIQVRSLELTVDVSPDACHLAKLLLNKKPCEGLFLHFDLNEGEENKYASLLQHVDSLRGLKGLGLRQSSQSNAVIHFCFRQLTGLSKLELGSGLHQDTVRSMLEASKLTLRELDCDDYDIAHLASTASQLRCIRVAGKGVSTNLEHLRQLKHLDVLSLTLQYYHCWPNQSEREKSEIVAHKLLNSSPVVAREVHLCLQGFAALHRWNTALGLRRVSFLAIGCERESLTKVPQDSQSLTAPLSLPDVIKLNVSIDQSLEPWWEGWRAAWLDSTAPILRQVYVVGKSGADGLCKPCREWLRVLRVKRPYVQISFM